jgi:hypothetical protein
MAATEHQRPTLFTRLAAALHGEVAATAIEAYRRAGASAYQDMLDAEQLRRDLSVAGGSLWTTRRDQASQLLCAWNAFVLQSLGDQLVDADYQADPHTVGFLPPVTAEQAAAFLGEVEQWSARARRAASDSGFDVAAEVALPAELPGWAEVEPCPRQHLAAMLAAGRAMRDRAQAALADLVAGDPPADKTTAASRLRGMAAEADTVMSYGESMWAPDVPAEVHERIENSLKRAIAAYYLLGQLLAMPALADQPAVTVATVTGPRLPLPGQPGFDPWCLTSPRSRTRWQRDPAAVRAVDLLWRYDPDPAATLTIQSQIDAALAAGLIATGVHADGQKAGQYYCCPWSAVYLVRRPVTIDGQRLRAGTEFVFDVSAEEMAEGGEFARRLLLGPFHETNQVDYCDPEGGHDDD